MAVVREHRQRQPDRRNVTIVLMNEARQPVLRWHVENAWINKIEGPSFKATGNEVAMESVELVHEGLTHRDVSEQGVGIMPTYDTPGVYYERADAARAGDRAAAHRHRRRSSASPGAVRCTSPVPIESLAAVPGAASATSPARAIWPTRCAASSRTADAAAGSCASPRRRPREHAGDAVVDGRRRAMPAGRSRPRARRLGQRPRRRAAARRIARRPRRRPTASHAGLRRRSRRSPGFVRGTPRRASRRAGADDRIRVVSRRRRRSRAPHLDRTRARATPAVRRGRSPASIPNQPLPIESIEYTAAGRASADACSRVYRGALAGARASALRARGRWPIRGWTASRRRSATERRPDGLGATADDRARRRATGRGRHHERRDCQPRVAPLQPPIAARSRSRR